MFPYGWPGRGLLLLRLGVVAVLTHDGIRTWMGAPQRGPLALYVVAAIAGLFLLLGLWTPVAGAIVALSEIGIVLTGTAHVQSTILLATQGIALAFLGPGSLSVDACRFGRKLINI
jgi:putative oxidoreductase